MAVNAGQARNIPGALSYGDPRELKQFLEDNGISCWLDVEQVGRVRGVSLIVYHYYLYSIRQKYSLI